MCVDIVSDGEFNQTQMSHLEGFKPPPILSLLLVQGLSLLFFFFNPEVLVSLSCFSCI